MKTTLRVIVDQILAPVPGGVGRYTEEITRELIAGAPQGCEVAGVVASSPPAEYNKLETLLPGLSHLYKSALARRELALAWQHGFTRLPGGGMVHSPSLLAPLSRHPRTADKATQTVVTVHDVVPFTHPETLTPHGVNWHRSMIKRAHQYADAIVVPTHAVAGQLADLYPFGERIRVIGGAVGSKLAIPVDAAQRGVRLGLPPRYLLSVGTLEPRKGLRHLIQALAHLDDPDLPLLIVGPSGWGDVDVERLAADAGLEQGRVRTLGYLSDADLAVAMDRATVFVFPSLAEGFGLPVLEAFSFGTPVVHSNAPAVVEVAAGAGVAVGLEDMSTFSIRLAEGITTVLNDEGLAERMGYAGRDRAKAFSWRDSAQRVWQLHADI